MRHCAWTLLRDLCGREAIEIETIDLHTNRSYGKVVNQILHTHRVFCVLCMLCLCCRACWRADRSACWAKGSCRQGGSCDGGWGNRGPSDFALQTSMASSNTKSARINGINSEICTNWSPSWWAPNTWCLMSQHTSTSTVQTLNGTTEWQKSFKTKKAQPGPNRSRHRGMIWNFELLLLFLPFSPLTYVSWRDTVRLEELVEELELDVNVVVVAQDWSDWSCWRLRLLRFV